MNSNASEQAPCVEVCVLRTGRGYVAAIVDDEGPVESSPAAHADRMRAAIEARQWSEAEGIALSSSVLALLAESK